MEGTEIRGPFEKFMDWRRSYAEGSGDCYAKL
jgi:hypothetical protein